MDKFRELLAELRAHRTNHGRQTSDTVQEWADKLETALQEHFVMRMELVDEELLAWLHRKGNHLERADARRRLIAAAERAIGILDGVAAPDRTCQECSGEGYVIRARFLGLWPVSERCRKCHGVGHV